MKFDGRVYRSVDQVNVHCSGPRIGRTLLGGLDEGIFLGGIRKGIPLEWNGGSLKFSVGKAIL